MAFNGPSSDANADLFRPVGDLVENDGGMFSNDGDGDQQLDAISVIPGSLCMACGESGDTRMLTTKIPFFREIIVCSFECETCGDTNNEVTFGGEIQEKGIRYTLEVKDKSDLNRSVIKADTAMVCVPSLELEIPARSQKGGITTVEGLLSKAAENLGMYQKERMQDAPEVGVAVGRVIMGLYELAGAETFPFTLIVDDPSGNSFVENRMAPSKDPQLEVTHYERNPMQDLAVGLQPSAEARAAGEEGKFDPSNKAHGATKSSNFDGAKEMMGKFGALPAAAGDGAAATAAGDGAAATAAAAAALTAEGEGDVEGEKKNEAAAAVVAETTTTTTITPGYLPDGSADLKEDLSTSLGRREILRIPIDCPNCQHPGEEDTCIADIPHFKEVIIMAFDCSECGYRSNEVKGGGGIPDMGQTFTLLCESEDDLARDVLKSATADVCLPELDFEASQASLGGVFTTVEGLLTKVHKAMLDSSPYMMGDSAQDSDRKTAYKVFSEKFAAFAAGEVFPFTLTLRDPLANSFIGTRRGLSPDEDPRLMIVDYARSFDEDEELGIHDMDVGDQEHYPPPPAPTAAVPSGGEGGGAGGESSSVSSNPNRALMHKRWGPDHPHEFAKGCDDDLKATPLGSEFDTGNWQTAASGGSGADGGAAAAAASEEASSSSSSGWCGPMSSRLPLQAAGGLAPEENADMKVAKAATAGTANGAAETEAGVAAAGAAELAVVEDEADLSLDFEASPSFAGAKSGFVFRTGAKGVGYYAEKMGL